MRAWYNERPAWQRANEKGHIQLVRDFCFFIENRGITTPYWVPLSYIDDGASIPGFLTPIYGSPFEPINADGAWPHDPGYLTHAIPRDIMDETARQIWIQAGKGSWMARQMWLGVRSPAGAMAWHNGPEEIAELEAMRAMIEARPDKEKFRTLWFAQSN